MKKQITNSKIIQLKNNPVKQYAWGSTKDSCYVSQISQKKGLKNYAQLWMGMHPHGQSQLQIGDSQDIIKLTQYFQQREEKPLSYLFKILSIQQCLSIQVHPNKQQAIRWHKQKPQIYNDDNDKPQMFYTLSEFQCFLGYVSKKQFDRLISLPIFSILSPKPQTPKQAIISILSLSQNSQSILLQKSLDSLSEIHPDRYAVPSHINLSSFPCLKLHSIPTSFPNDIGIVITFFLNYLVIPSGKCYYIGPNTPHAYIYGECLEIMKNSDNVLRLGLTPKGKDLGAVGEGLAQWNQKGKSLEGQVQGNEAIDGILYERQGLNLLIIKNKKLKKQSTKYKILPSPYTRICLFLNRQVSISIASCDHSGPQSGLSMPSSRQIASTILLQPQTSYTLTYPTYENRCQQNQKQKQKQIGKIQTQTQAQIQAQQNVLACIGWATF